MVLHQRYTEQPLPDKYDADNHLSATFAIVEDRHHRLKTSSYQPPVHNAMAAYRSYEFIKLDAIHLLNAMEDLLLAIQAERSGPQWDALFDKSQTSTVLTAPFSTPDPPSTNAEQMRHLGKLGVKVQTYRRHALDNTKALEGYIEVLHRSCDNYTQEYWAIDRMVAVEPTKASYDSKSAREIATLGYKLSV